MAVVAAGLTLTSGGYGYDRDELYFRLLDPHWGYVDQPPLTPLVVHGVSAVVDRVWAIRLPGTVMVVLTVLVVALLAREFGGGRRAQALAAWGFGTGAFTLVLGHAALTATIDMPFWPAIVLMMVRAQVRAQPRWWLLAGLLVGVDLLNKVLVLVLLAALALGIVVAGPRSLLRSRWVWAGVLVAVVAGSPTIVYQVAHGLPQLTMGRALAAHNGGDVRVQMWWFLFLILGPPLTVIWGVGVVALWRRPALRFVAASLPFLLLGVFTMGSQVYYPFGLLVVLFAAGCEPTLAWWSRGRGRRPWVIGLVVVNALVSVVLGLPVVPVTSVGATPVPGVNLLAADSIGWPAYVRQIRGVFDAAHDPRAVVLASNYGEAGAVSRYAPDLPVFSGQNALWDRGAPPASATTAVVVGGQYDLAATLFAHCRAVTHLDNDVDVDNEEQGETVGVCTSPRGGWVAVWPRLRHLD